MNEKWRAPAAKVRRCVWLTELVTVLVLLLVYKFTESDTVLMSMFMSIIVASVPMAVATMIIDSIDLERLGDDE
jgi:hypothetical protein